MDKNYELVILIGPPGSGKSTYCEKFLSEHYRISQDDQGKNRHMELYKKAIQDGIEKIVVDRMNFNLQQRSKYTSLIPKKYKIIYVEMLLDKNLCLDRIKNRKEHPTLDASKIKTADEVIDFFYKNYQMPDPEKERFEYVVWSE